MNILIEFEKQPLAFRNPVSVIRCYTHAELADCLAMIEQWLAHGYYAAGFLSYEAGYAFEGRLSTTKAYDFPLLYFGCYTKPAAEKIRIAHDAPTPSIRDLSIQTPRSRYTRDIGTIRDHIALGDVYQITYCIKLKFTLDGSAIGLYRLLSHAQPVPYPAYLETDGFTILSLSPEMFIKKTGGSLVTKPMKGTWPRGNNRITDLVSSLRLKYDTKNRAENLMITDLLRNDIGKIGHGIRVPRLFEVARYTTLNQMTSTVTGTIRADIALHDLFAALFPSGSVTGAPKIRAMEIIRQLEQEERRIYTGAIGYIAPNKDMFFNIPIRTILLRGTNGEMGIGGGIVWDSTPEGEWAEGMLKARFLTDMAGGPDGLNRDMSP